MANIKGIIVEIGGDTSGLQKALSKVNSSTASLSKELKGINSLLKLDPTNTELVSQKQEVLKENIEQTTKKLEELKKTQELADETIASGGKISQENYRNLQREIINTENKLNSLKLEASKWTTAGRSIEEFGNKVSNISNKVDKLGTTITTRLTLPLAALATGFINAAKDFETAFTGVEKTVDGTTEQLKKIRQGIKDLSEEIPSSTTEIASVAEAAGQLGIATDDILEFTKVMIDLGNSTNLTADEAASALAKFANVTKMSSKDYSKLGSTIVALGNNFATTEADIVSMSTRLAATGELAGLSQPEILALATAMSSVGIEAEAGGSAMSKLLKKIQVAVETGSSELKDFASVAGMSTKDFKKAFEDNAVSALSAFISGLNDTKRNGKSAITILEDMELKEVRLSNTILSLSNASGVLNNAIEMSQESWEENNALTKEANKRYETLDSRLQITKNKILNVATNTGDKLTPTFNKLLDKIDNLVDKFDDLSEEEIVNIAKTGLLVASIGPAIKIIGTLGTTIGSGAKAIGTFSQAIGVLRSNTKSGVESVDNLANSLKILKSPVGLLGIEIAGLAGFITYLNTNLTEEQKQIKETNEQIIQQRDEYIKNQETLQKTLDGNLAEIDNIQKLRNELSKLVDENGKVKEGYEGRVNFILNELNNALGTEYSLNKNIITQYNNLRDSIDEVIQKKRAEIILSNKEQAYDTAINNIEEYKKTLADLNMTEEEYTKKKDELEQKKQDHLKETFSLTTGIAILREIQYNKDKKKLEEQISSYENAKNNINDAYTAIEQYEEAYALYSQGTAESIEQINTRISGSYIDLKNTSIKQLQEEINISTTNLEILKDRYKDTQNQITLAYIEEEEKRLTSVAESLAAQTNTIEEISPEVKEAWTKLATESYEIYSIQLSKMSPEMQKKIQETTGVIAAGTPQMQEKADELGRKTIEQFDKSADARQKALDILEAYLNGLEDEEKRELLQNAGIENVNIVIDELNRGDLSEKNGKNILEGLWRGLKNNSWKDKILGVASGIAKAVNKCFTGKDGWDEHSPSKKMTKYTENYIKPISLTMQKRKNTITSEARKLVNGINSEFNENSKLLSNFDNLQGKLKSNIIDSTRTIFTTPQIIFNVQKLSDQELDHCFEYVNKKFGSEY